MERDEISASGDESQQDGPAGRKLWHVGTLTYTRAQLFNVFFWLLWGDFCLNVMESVIPRLVPLQLHDLGASNTLIALLTVTIFSAMNWVLNPIISTWSDRHRGPRGRRIPFMLFPTPPLAFFLISVGFAANIASYVHARHPAVARAAAAVFSHLLPMSGIPVPAQFAIGALAVALICYRFFDQFPQCVYYYIWADVIPQHLMGRFTSLFRVVATAGGVVFHAFVLQYADKHPAAVYLGCGMLYFAAFMMMCVMIREGSYPPPPELPKGEGKSIRTIAQWLRECFSHNYYWRYYLAFACFRWAYYPFNAMLIIYATTAVGMDDKAFGHRMAIIMTAQLPIFLLLGPVVDRFHPVRVAVVGYLMMAAAGVLAFCFTHGPTTFLIWMVVLYVAIAVNQGAIVALGPRLLPRSRYGQFCSSTMMVVELGMLSMSWLCGYLMDRAGQHSLWLWLAGFSAVGFAASVILYHGWQRHGGDDAYLAPGDFDQPLDEAPLAAAHSH